MTRFCHLSAARWILCITASTSLSCSTRKPEVDTAVTLSESLTLGTVKSLGQPNSNYWENVTLAVPPNTASCGSAGAVVYALGGSIQQGTQLCNMLRFDLTCVQSSGTSCPVNKCVTLPKVDNNFQISGQGGDPNLLRIPAGADPKCSGNHGTLLHQRQIGGNHGDTNGSRGSEYIFASCDCGSTWTLRSIVDPKDFFGKAYINRAADTDPNVRTGFDRVDFQYDTIHHVVYLSAGAAGPGLESEVLFRSDDAGVTWRAIGDRGAGSRSPFASNGGGEITVSPSGKVYLLGASGESDGTAPYVVPVQGPPPRAPNIWHAILQYYDSADESVSPVLFPSEVADAGEADVVRGAARTGLSQIARVASSSVGDFLNLAYTSDENQANGHPRLFERVVTVKVTSTTAPLGNKRVRIGRIADRAIRPSSAAGSILWPTLIEPDFLESPTNPATGASFLHWTESTKSEPTIPDWGTLSEKAVLLDDVGHASAVQTLSTSWSNFSVMGDYKASAYYYTSNQLNFVPQWTQGTASGPTLTTRPVTHPYAAPTKVPTKDNYYPKEDYDGDGKADFALFRPSDGNWYIKQSSGGADIVRAWGNAFDVFVPGDYDGDGRSDFALWRASDHLWYIAKSNGGVPDTVDFGTATDRFTSGDFDGDGKSDLAFFRASEPAWHIRPSGGGAPYTVTWGYGTDKLVPADYDGDGKTDVAVYRPSNGTWFIIPSKTGVAYSVPFGSAADKPLPADYDGDGKADLAYFRPSEPAWHISPSGGGQNQTVTWGVATDRMVPADYDGDGKADLAYFRPSEGNWHVLPSLGGNPIVAPFGTSKDLIPIGTVPPVPTQDYDGDRIADEVVFRPSVGNWFVHPSAGGADLVTTWGNSNDVFVPGDYDGDHKTDVALFRPSEGNWWIVPSGGGSMSPISWGTSTDKPVPGDYDGDNRTDCAYFRPSDGTWHIRPSSGAPPFVVNWGNSTDQLVPADYDGDGKMDPAIFRPSDNKWWIVGFSDGISFGTGAHRKVPGDYDGDGRADLAFFGNSDGNWQIRPSGGGTDIVVNWGGSSDRLVPADYDGDGRSDIVIFRPSEGNWWFQSTGTAVQFGVSTDVIPYSK